MMIWMLAGAFIPAAIFLLFYWFKFGRSKRSRTFEERIIENIVLPQKTVAKNQKRNHLKKHKKR